MEPDVLFHTVMFVWFRKIAQLCGMDIFVDKFKPSLSTYLLMCSIYSLFLICLWTIYSLPFDGKVICVSVLFFDCQGIVKMNSILKNNRKLSDICNFCLKIYKANKNAGANKTRLEKSVNLTILIFKCGLVLLAVTGVLTCIRPCVTYLSSGKLETIIPTVFPGINEQDPLGFTCLAVFHIYIMAMFVLGTAGIDLGMMTTVIHCHTMSHIYQNAVTDFNMFAEKNKRKTKTKEVDAFLNNLILMHIDFIQYTKTLKMIFNEVCLIQISMSNAVMVVLVYVILMLEWFPAYFLIVTAFFQVFEYSLLGTVVEIGNENVYNAVIDIQFLDLPIKEQKKIILMTLIAQHPQNLTVGGFQKLNIETFVFSMKNTYSVAMLLLSTRK